MQSIQGVLAPAKLNLFLHITGQRPDGYHLLQSVFMLIDWYDSLDFELQLDGHIERLDISPLKPEEVQSGPKTQKPATQQPALPDNDLCVLAALALQKATGCKLGAKISLHKTIPQQAGMGGGSSNAASTLLALNRLWGLDLSRQDLMRIAVPLGADVPFFLLGSNAWVEGIGDKLEPIELAPAKWVVIKPKEGVSTQQIFRDPLLQRDTKTVTIFDFAAQPFGFGRNDLQPVAQRLCPEIAEAIEWLDNQGLKARMTGSGSAVFANLPLGAALKTTPQESLGWQLRVCSNLDKHPHSDWVSSDK
jgi:4-diphosphocytidyl-2-C-methyl-D-erythritol kinase